MKLPISVDDFDVKDASMCGLAVSWLYEAIEQAHGEAEARRMFAVYGREPTPRQIARQKNLALVCMLLDMPKPNKQKLAEDLAEKNRIMAEKKLPRAKFYGPRGSTSPAAMLKQINRVLGQKEYLHLAHAVLASL
jgi:hypothetical protein